MSRFTLSSISTEGYWRMDNPEKLAILGTKDIGGRQTKLKTHHRKLKE
jgi:hypothetical protein